MVFRIHNLFFILFLFITIAALDPFLSISIGSTTFWWIADAIMIFLFIKLKPIFFNIKDEKIIWPVLWYLTWNILCIARGFFVAENYWEWKHLISTAMIMLLPLVIYISTNKDFVQWLISFWLKYALPIFFVFLPFIIVADFVGRYLVPIMFLLLFFPLLTGKWKVIVVFFTLMVFVAGFDARSNIIRFSVAILIGTTFYYKRLMTPHFFKTIRALFFIIPVILLALAITGVFNVFEMDRYIENDYSVKVFSGGQEVDVSLKADTRTFLYDEVLNSAINNNYILFGRTPARGYESLSFGEHLADELKTGKMERFGSEVSIHNIFTYTGLVGVLLYFLVFFRASYLAIYQSNNMLIKNVGLFVSFRWAYAFVEDFTNFDLQYLFLWMMIGMCYSSSFRAMSDLEMKVWVKGIFDRRYVRVLNWYNLQKQVLLRSKLKEAFETK